MTLQLVRKCLKPGQPLDLLAIEHFHWLEDRTEFPGVYTLAELWDFVHRSGDAFMVDPGDPLGRRRLKVLAAKTPTGQPYLKTEKNSNLTSDPLLSLPDCS